MRDVIRVSHGVWRPAEQVADLAGRCAAALSALPPGAVVSGPTAAMLRGTWLPSRVTGGIELTVPGEARQPRDLPGTRREELRLRRRYVLPDEVETVDGLPMTTAARTWLDLSETLRAPELIAAGDWTIRAGVDPSEIGVLLRRATHRRGVILARECLPLLHGGSASRPESHLRAALVLAGLPVPDVNVHIHDENGQWLAQPDLSYRRARLALEYQGEDHADPDRMPKNLTRTLDLQRHRWTAWLFGPAETFGRPDQIVSMVRGHLRTHGF